MNGLVLLLTMESTSLSKGKQQNGAKNVKKKP